jgi:hypothetical protein
MSVEQPCCVLLESNENRGFYTANFGGFLDPGHHRRKAKATRLACRNISAQTYPPSGFCQTDQPAIDACRRSLRRKSMANIRSSLRSRWTS